MTDKMARLHGEEFGIRAKYLDMTRNQDPEIRKLFKEEKEIDGTLSWAIATAMTMSNPSVVLSDEVCDKIIAILS